MNRKLKRTAFKLRKYLTFVLVYLTIVGIYTFSAFIIEEAQQQTVWGTWPAQDAKNWELVLEGCDLLESLNSTLWWMNWTIGYIQPLALISYHSYWKATRYYIKSLKTKIFAKSPETFDGRHIEFMFTPQKIIQKDGKVILVNRRIRVVVKEVPDGKTVKIKGIVRVENNLVIVEDEGIEENE